LFVNYARNILGLEITLGLDTSFLRTVQGEPESWQTSL